MGRVQGYLLKNFSESFFPIFLTLFVITSMIFIIQISSLTTTMKITFPELFFLYATFLPNVLTFTIPASFFAAAVIAFAKMSMDSELIVLFSLRLRPKDMIAPIFYLSIVVSLVLLISSLALKPLAKQKRSNFKSEKVKEASFNLEASKFGQKFSGAVLFIEEKVGEKDFKNIILYKQDERQENEQIYISDRASMDNNDGVLQFKMDTGKSFIFNDTSMFNLSFSELLVNNPLKEAEQSYKDLISYWSNIDNDTKLAESFTKRVLVGIMPTMMIFVIMTLGVINPRYEKNNATFKVILVTVLYYGLVVVLSKKLPVTLIGIFPVLWLASTYYIYRIKTVSRF